VAEILFVTWDGGGNVPPAVGIATELQRRGHAVRFLAHATQVATLREKGLCVSAFERARPFSSAVPNSPIALMRMFGDRRMGEDLVAAVSSRPADLVVIDCLLMAALDAARRAGLRYVPLEHLFDGFLRKRWLRGPMGLSGTLRGLRPRRNWDAAPLTLAATLAELDPASRGASPANLRYSGPVVAGAPRPARASAPTVLVSLSTYNFPGQTAAMQNILDALATLDVRSVVTTGPVIDAADLRVPPRAEVHRFVPHAELMPEVSLVISHGGHATATQALAHDLPLLVMPMHPMLDQSMVGQAVEQAGAGRVMGKKSAPARLAPIIESLLAPGAHRAAAARLGALIRRQPGASTASDLLEGLLSSDFATPGSARAPAHC
jgi:UDP:flavonoid glycosyltransferase YjiC (YdhE family)